MKRKQFTKEERRLVWNSCNKKCASCGRPLTMKTLTLDHVIPLAKGGPDDLSNVVAMCRYCNELKADKICVGPNFLTALGRTNRGSKTLLDMFKFIRKHPDVMEFDKYPLGTPFASIDMTTLLLPDCKQTLPQGIIDFGISNTSDYPEIQKAFGDVALIQYSGYWRFTGRSAGDMLVAYKPEDKQAFVIMCGNISERFKKGLAHTFAGDMINDFTNMGFHLESMIVSFDKPDLLDEFAKGKEIEGCLGNRRRYYADYPVLDYYVCAGCELDDRDILKQSVEARRMSDHVFDYLYSSVFKVDGIYGRHFYDSKEV